MQSPRGEDPPLILLDQVPELALALTGSIPDEAAAAGSLAAGNNTATIDAEAGRLLAMPRAKA